VRSVIERAVLEMVSRIYRAPAGVCASPIGTSADPLADAADRPYPYAQQAYAQPYQQPYPQPYQQPNPYQPAYAPNAYNQENYNEYARQIPYNGYGSSDPVGDVRLRAGY
jgi:hypothetical protein